MTHRIYTIVLISLFLYTANARAAGSEAALSKASIAEGSAAFVDTNRIGGPRALGEALDKMKRCVAAVDTAISSGATPATMVKVYDSKPYKNGKRVKKPGYTAKHYAPLGQIRDHCKAKFASLRVVSARWGIEEVIAATERLRTIRKPHAHSTVAAKLAYDKCVKQVEQSLALGASPSTPLVAKQLKLTLGTARAKGCGMILPAIAAVKAKANAAVAAKFAPYKRALRGDKWRVFKRYNMIHFRVFGYRGRVLSTPRKLARARVWFEILNTGKYRRWAMRRFQFNRRGRLVSKRTVRGRGHRPPRRAYR